MDERLQQFWRQFTTEPSIENYEKLGLAYNRAGFRPRVVDIAARIFVPRITEDITGLVHTDRQYACNLNDPNQISANYVGSTTVDTNHRIFFRAEQLKAGTLKPNKKPPLLGGNSELIGNRLVAIPGRRSVKSFMFTNDGWTIYVELFRPEALSDYGMNMVGLVFVADPVNNVIGWHSRMVQPFSRSADRIAENVFLNCDDEIKHMFRNAMIKPYLKRYGRKGQAIVQKSWNDIKRLFIDIITTL